MFFFSLHATNCNFLYFYSSHGQKTELYCWAMCIKDFCEIRWHMAFGNEKASYTKRKNFLHFWTFNFSSSRFLNSYNIFSFILYAWFKWLKLISGKSHSYFFIYIKNARKKERDVKFLQYSSHYTQHAKIMCHPTISSFIQMGRENV